jgi:hypothetical protein
MTFIGDDPIATLTKQGLSPKIATDLVATIEQCETMDDVKRAISVPDDVYHWDCRMDEKVRAEFNRCGVSPEKWEQNKWHTCHSYSRRWWPAFLQVVEQEDGQISFGFGVIPNTEKPKV